MSNEIEHNVSDCFDKAIAAWTTPVAPVSPDTDGKCGELETVAQAHFDEFGEFDDIAWIKGFHPHPECIQLVTRSQAEELLAAEVRRERDLAAKQLSEVVDRMSDDYLALKAELDQAVGAIEDRSSEYEALEAKLAAAEKALTEIASFTQTTDLLWWQERARAALGGRPS